MKLFHFLFCITIIIMWGCSSDLQEPETPENFIAESHYKFDVSSSLGSIHTFDVEGTTTSWDPFIGYMSLGPDVSCLDESASLTMSATEEIDFNSDLVTSLKWSVDMRFYSIIYWCLPLGDQEANFYSASPPLNITEEEYEFGIDDNGVKYFKGKLVIVLNRDILNEEDEDEVITVTAEFVAVDR